MTDIFISYASDDRPTAKSLADALTQQGFSVWWDRKIPTGEAFDEELEKQLEQARAVVVLWSSRSVKSKWVRDETSEGLAKKALFPVMIEDVRLPFGYRRIQTADFKQWKAGDSHLGFDQLVTSLRRAFGGQGGTLELQGDHPALLSVRHNWVIDRWRRSIAFRIGTLALPAVVMGLGAVAMMKVRMPTHVQLDLTVQKVKFTMGGANRAPILDTLGFSELGIEKFRSVSLSPKSLRVVDAEKLDAAPEHSKPALWRELRAPGQLTFTGTDESLQPAVRIAGILEDAKSVGTLDLLLLDPDSVVTLERRGKRRGLLVKVEGQSLSPAAIVSAPIRILTEHAAAKELGAVGLNPVYEAQMRDSSPEIKIESAPNGLTLKIGTVGDAVLALLPKGGTAIKDVSLLDMSVEDKWESTLIVDGSLSYPEHPAIAPIVIAKSDLIGLTELSRFAITQLNLDPQGAGLQVRLDGKARKVVLRAGEFSRDARLSMLDIYRSSANAVFLVTLVLGVVSATWSAFLTVRELRG